MVGNVRDGAEEFHNVAMGGTELVFEGEYLDSVAYPKLELLSYSHQSQSPTVE